VIELYYAVPCEACFVSEDYMAAKGIFTLSKEQLEKFLVWVKIKQT
jgi:hypothetical protein